MLGGEGSTQAKLGALVLGCIGSDLSMSTIIGIRVYWKALAEICKIVFVASQKFALFSRGLHYFSKIKLDFPTRDSVKFRGHHWLILKLFAISKDSPPPLTHLPTCPRNFTNNHLLVIICDNVQAECYGV